MTILKEYIKDYRTISIIGTYKNVGKTTVLNQILKEYYGHLKVGVTSIGVDGETIDTMTFTEKPRIYVEQGTIIATCDQCLRDCDFTVKILESTNIQTALGHVVVVEALSNGYAFIAGPSMNSQVKNILHIFARYGVELSIIDGALSRKSNADNYISDATIIATGASYSEDLHTVVNDTSFIINCLSLPKLEEIDVYEMIYHNFDKSKVIIIDKENNYLSLQLETALHAENEIFRYVNKDTRYIAINGALTTNFLKTAIDNRPQFEQLTIVVKNGTKILIDPKYFNKLVFANISIKVLEKTNLLCLTYNPTSPYGYVFDDDTFKQELKKRITIPIINILGGK